MNNVSSKLNQKSKWMIELENKRPELARNSCQPTISLSQSLVINSIKTLCVKGVERTSRKQSRGSRPEAHEGARGWALLQHCGAWLEQREVPMTLSPMGVLVADVTSGDLPLSPSPWPFLWRQEDWFTGLADWLTGWLTEWPNDGWMTV